MKRNSNNSTRNLLIRKEQGKSIHQNPNLVITNFFNHVLINGKNNILKFWLKHGLLISQMKEIFQSCQRKFEKIDKTNIYCT